MIQKGGLDARTAEDRLQGTFSPDKNEILWSHGINYNNEPEMFRKGSVVFRAYELEDNPKTNGNETVSLGQSSEQEPNTELQDEDTVPSKTQAEKMRKAKAKARVAVEHIDIIRDEFWDKRPWILSGKPGKPIAKEQS